MNTSIQAREAGRTGAPPPLVPLIAAALLTLPALILSALPGAATALEFSREGVARGEWWRVVTGHWTHWSSSHLIWDIAALALLGAIGWSMNARGTLAALAASVIAIPLAVWVFLPEMTSYRGLSGLDSALFVFVAATLWREERAAGRHGAARLLLLVLAGFLVKVGVELMTGTTLFADSERFVPVPLAHLVGGACGGVVGCSLSGVARGRSVNGQKKSGRPASRPPSGLAGSRTRHP